MITNYLAQNIGSILGIAIAGRARTVYQKAEL
jgi:hypothetical protein